MLRSRGRSPSPSVRPVGRAKAARARSPSPFACRVDIDIAEKPADAIVHAIQEIFTRFGVDEDGTLDRDVLVTVLKELDPDTWSDKRLQQLLPTKGARRTNRIQFEDFLNWLFCDGADQAALQSGSVSAVFSYGTLRGDDRPRGDRWGVVEEYKAKWQRAKLRGFRLYQDADRFPIAVHTGNHDDILVGTLLQFPDEGTAKEAIRRCDHIEGYDPTAPRSGLYRRTTVEIEVPGEHAVVAVIYYQRFPESQDLLWLGFKGLCCTHIEHIGFPRRPLGLTYVQGIVTKVKEDGLASEAGIEPGWHIVSLNFCDVSTTSPSGIQAMVADAISHLPESSDKELKRMTEFCRGDWLGQRLFPTFGFGSNSIRQLRGRLDDGSLRGYAARVFDQVLAFSGPNWTWSVDDDDDDGGTATLVPLTGEVALGTVAFLTESQLETLDGFEGAPYVYQRQNFPAEVLQSGRWCRMLVIAYIKVAKEWYPPTEAYRCAVLRNISGSFPSTQKLVLRDTEGEVRGEWQHPGYSALGLGAFLFEVGVRRAEPWELPRKIDSVKGALEDAGISRTVGAVAAALEAGSLPFSEEEIEIVRCLLTKTKGKDDDHVDVEDDSMAERAMGDLAVAGSHAVKARPKAKSRVSGNHSRVNSSPRARSPAR